MSNFIQRAWKLGRMPMPAYKPRIFMQNGRWQVSKPPEGYLDNDEIFYSYMKAVQFTTALIWKQVAKEHKTQCRLIADTYRNKSK